MQMDQFEHVDLSRKYIRRCEVLSKSRVVHLIASLGVTKVTTLTDFLNNGTRPCYRTS